MANNPYFIYGNPFINICLDKLKDLLATEKQAGGQKVWQLKEQKILPEEEWDGDSSSDEGIED